MATVLNLSGLSEYIETRRDELFVKSAMASKTLDYIETMLNVKHKANLNYLDSEVVFQEQDCQWTPQGSDSFSQRTISVTPIEIEKTWCMSAFRDYWMNYELRYAAGREQLPKEEALVESNLRAIEKALENLIWKGDSGLSIDGFVKQIETEGTVVNVGSGATATDMIDAAVAAATSQMLAKGVNVFVSETLGRQYVMESNGTCCAGRPIQDAAARTYSYLGDSRITIIPVAGLEGLNVVVAASKDALVYATDIEDSEAIYELFFDRKDAAWNFRVLFNAGTALKFVDEAIIVEEGE